MACDYPLMLNSVARKGLACRIISLSLLLGGCTKNEMTMQPDVYVTGAQGQTGGYWKSGNFTALPGCTLATAGMISGNDVYISGYSGTLSNSVAKYWKNGKAVPLVDSTTIPITIANSIFVSGLDVYVAGSQGSTKLLGWINQDSTVAVFWKNGQMTRLPITGISYANSVFVAASDVYIIGDSTVTVSKPQNVTELVGYSKVWKNGIRFSLPAGEGIASGLSVGNDVYLAGSLNNQAAYWKNGNPVTLPYQSGVSTTASSIAVSGNDIYLSGLGLDASGNIFTIFWKNNTPTLMLQSTIVSVVASSGNYFIAGKSANASGYWYNNTFVSLGSSNVTVTSIFQGN
jgi:hypothetical protein